jgi:hypothetical protein
MIDEKYRVLSVNIVMKLNFQLALMFATVISKNLITVYDKCE